MTDKKVLMMLNQSPADCSLERQLKIASTSPKAGAILMQDAVYFAATEEGRKLLDAGVTVYALRQSVEARGLTGRTMDGVELVDYDRVVDLIMEEYDVVV
ncbi:MAG: sulfurtransferase complex subunit TusB [Thermoplasmata archaeon]|nr:sulfurtransferase complex subunit TusB [Thermoplasmata archaeon]